MIPAKFIGSRSIIALLEPQHGTDSFSKKAHNVADPPQHANADSILHMKVKSH
jgi:hypothetical protein